MRCTVSHRHVSAQMYITHCIVLADWTAAGFLESEVRSTVIDAMRCHSMRNFQEFYTHFRHNRLRRHKFQNATREELGSSDCYRTQWAPNFRTTESTTHIAADVAGARNARWPVHDPGVSPFAYGSLDGCVYYSDACGWRLGATRTR